ncbi:MAG: LamG-like jellyroll fold domain-containing protein, partial [Candidatus Micrarchaeaceae archaeon]
TVYVNGVAVGIDSSGSVSSCNDYPKMWYNASANVAKGEMANAQIYATALSANQIQQLYQNGISAPPIANAGLVGWWPLNGNANDYSGNGNNGTVYGAASFAVQNLAASNYTSSLAASFNGQNSVITAPISLNSSSFSIVFWANPANQLKITSANGYTVMNSIGTNTLEVWLNNGGGVGASPGSGDEELGIGSNYYHGFGINANTFNFIGISVNNGKISFYANGAGPYNVSGVAGPYNINSISLAQSAGGISMFNGSIANFQIYSTALPPSAVQTLYAGGISGTPIANAGLVGWWPLNGNANDYSGNGNNGTATNVGYVGVVSRTYNPLNSAGTYGLSFNGQNTAVYATKSVSIPFSYTISQWFKLNSAISPSSSVLGGASPIVDIYNASSNGGIGGNQNHDFAGTWAGGSSGIFSVAEDWPQNWQFCTTPAGLIKPNVWYNAIVSVNAYDSVVIYLNGVNVTSCTLTVPEVPVLYPAVGIGGNPPGGLELANASIADVQIYNTAINASEARTIYEEGLHNFASSIIPMSWYP